MTRGWQTQGRSTRDRRRKKQQRAPRPLSESARPVAEKERSEPARPAASSSGWRQPSGRTAAVQTIRPEEYHYVYGDLKRIAVLSVIVFSVLIALSFVIK